MSNSRIPGFSSKSVSERLETLVERGVIDSVEVNQLQKIDGTLSPAVADKLIENVIGVFGLPFAVAPNFLVNGRDYVVPMVTEEPSVVAGASGAARLMRRSGGFRVTSDDALLVGQIQIVDVDDPDKIIRKMQASVDHLLEQANALQPRLVARGGGARSIEFLKYRLPEGRWTVVVHVSVDTCDAMGANLVNSICEGLAPVIEGLSGCRTALRILSNLADKALVTATVTVQLQALRRGGFAAKNVRDSIVAASNLAQVDRYRAATHNKGIMNGVDAVAIATGNDWRAIEAAAHAYASRDGSYRSLSRWSATPSGDLSGTLTMPLKVGIVGGSLQSNPAAGIGLKIAAVESAGELAHLMCATGLAQNFAALRALVTTGIQYGHMRLHARSVASVAGAPPAIFDKVVDGLIDSGEIKNWKAVELIESIQATGHHTDSPNLSTPSRALGTADGKVILLGEHAAVYGKHALAIPIKDAMTANCRSRNDDLLLQIPEWGIRQVFETGGGDAHGAAGILQLLLSLMNASEQALEVTVSTRLPVAMGLGSSAALAAAIARALSQYLSLGLSDDDINRLTFECERLSHGEPSGIDNTVAVYGKPVLFDRISTTDNAPLNLRQLPPLVIACSGTRGTTLEQVAGVRNRRERNRLLYDRIFDEIDSLSIAGADALQDEDYDTLGAQMNVCQGLLNAIEVSTVQLENMVNIARLSGAVGAKLTGAGGGGSIVALCPGTQAAVAEALQANGYTTIELELQPVQSTPGGITTDQDTEDR